MVVGGASTIGARAAAMLVPFGKRSPASGARARITTASRSAALRTEFAFTVKLFTPRRMVPRLVSRPGWISPAYSISSGVLRVQKRPGSDLR